MKLKTLSDVMMLMMSLPAWGRGLKHLTSGRFVPFDASLPAWGRGLKHIRNRLIKAILVSLPCQ